jgi:hypothetical protein
MKTFTMIVFFLLTATIINLAQIVDGQFITNVVGSTYQVTLAANMRTGVGSAGVILIDFTYNTASVTFPSAPVSGVDYVLQGNFANFPTKNIIWISPNTIRTALATFGAPAPVPLSTTPVNIIQFNLTITNPAGTSDLTWTQTGIAPQFGLGNYTVGNWPNIASSPLPVELSTFTAHQSGENISLTWRTETEVGNVGFDIERKSEILDWQKIGFIKGNGYTNKPHEYSFKDLPSGSNNYQYRLKQIDNNGKSSYSTFIDVKLELPKKFVLEQNYPNPFNPNTNIRFQLPKDSRVSIKIYNMLGQEVSTLIDQDMSAGYQTISFDASKIASGTYLYRIEAGSFSNVKKMIILK